MPSRATSRRWRYARLTLAQANDRAYSGRNQPCASRQAAGGDLDEDELAGGSRHHRRPCMKPRRPVCRLELVVRGICCLRPGIVGPFGEHPGQIDHRPLPRSMAESTCFRDGAMACPGAKAAVYISSADMMPRNLGTGRVEVPLSVCKIPRCISRFLETDHGGQPQGQRAELAVVCRTGSSTRMKAAKGEEPFQPAQLLHDQSESVRPVGKSLKESSPRRLNAPYPNGQAFVLGDHCGEAGPRKRASQRRGSIDIGSKFGASRRL